MKKFIQQNSTLRKVLQYLKDGNELSSSEFIAMFPETSGTLADVVGRIKRHEPDEHNHIVYRKENGMRVYSYCKDDQKQAELNLTAQPEPQPEQTTKSALDRIADALEKLVNACVIDTNVSLDELRKQQFTEMAIRLYTNKNEMYNH